MEITKLKDTVLQKAEELQQKAEPMPVVKNLAAFIGAFLLSNPFVSGVFAPFSVSLTAAAGVNSTVGAGAGAILGSFFFFDGTDSVKYCAAVLMCVLIKGIYLRFLSRDLLPTAMYLNSFSSLLLTGTAIIFATGFSFEASLCVFYESVLCCVGAYLFSRASSLVWGKTEFSRFTNSDIITVLMTLGIILMPFYKYKIIGFSPVTMLFAACILLFARLRGSSGGALCGICLGAVTGLSSEIGIVSVGYSLGGLAGGELSRKGKIPCAIGYLVPVAVCAVADGTLSSYMAIFEGIAAAAVFLAIPDRHFDSLCSKINAPAPTAVKNNNSQISHRLYGASDAITEVSACIDTVQNTLTPLTQTQLGEVVKNAWCKVCNECELRESCRPEIRNPTDESINRLVQALENRAELDETRFPKGFYSACYCFSEMRTQIYDRYLSFSASQSAQGKISQVQGLMCDQFRSLADILGSIARDLDEDAGINTEVAELCLCEATESGLRVIGSDCRFDKFGRLSLSMTVETPRPDFNITQLTKNLSTATGTKLGIPELDENGDECTLNFRQKLDFEISIGAISRPTDNETVCGDYYRSFRDADGRYIVILSDGMGTGSRAAVDSAMAAELFSKLVRSGLSFDSALRIANSALLIKSADESLATLDVVCVDLYTGRADFMKAGAAATFVRHKDTVAQLEQASLPIGILRDTSFAKATAALSRGDIILMVSDGILGESNNWIQHELKDWDTQKSPDELARFILGCALERKRGKHIDDMTVIAVYVQ